MTQEVLAMFESGEVCAEQGAPMTYCLTCGAALDPDWLDWG
jgi:hypothetical protein